MRAWYLNASGQMWGFFFVSDLEKKKKECWDSLDVGGNVIDRVQCKFLTQGGALPSWEAL